MLLRASATELLSIDMVSDIQLRVEALEKTQKDCIQLLNEELEEKRSVVALFMSIKTPSIEIHPRPTVIFFTEEEGGGLLPWTTIIFVFKMLENKAALLKLRRARDGIN